MSEHYDDAPNFSLHDVLDTLRRRKWVIIQALIFVTAIGVVTAALSPPVYSTAAKLLVDTPGNVVLSQVNTSDALAPLMVMRQQKSVETQIAIMRSAEFRQRLMEKLRNGEGTVGAALTYRPIENTSIISILAESADPKAAAAWANAAAQEYVELTGESNRAAISETRKYLEEQTGRAQRELTVAERKLLLFKSRTEMADSEEERTVRVQDALDLETKAREARSEKLSLEVKIRGLQSRLAREAATIREMKVLPNPEVEAVRSQIARLKAERAVLLGVYQPESAKVQDLNAQISSLEEAMGGMKPTLQEEHELPNARRQELEEQLRELELQRDAAAALSEQLGTTAGAKTNRVSQFAPWQVQLTQIQRERDQAEKTYLDYSDKLRELRVREKALVATASVMEDAPVPGAPIRPQKAQQVAVAVMMGLLLGVGFAFLQEFLDDRINTSEDIERLAALPTLGAIPSFPAETRPILIGKDVLGPITESYRSLRTSVRFSAIDRPVRSLLVTSSHAGEGKSVTSANTAIAMALEGRRVLLVDADLRRPSLHKLFEFEQQPGLSNVLAGDVDLIEVLRETPVEGLRVLTAGPLPPNPAELLNSQAMLDLMDRLLQLADVVVFDTPPLLPVTDAQVLAAHVDGAILVVEAGSARKAAVKHARDLLDLTRVRILGVVLNRIDRTQKGYYYHYYARGGYGRSRGRYGSADGYLNGYGDYSGNGQARPRLGVAESSNGHVPPEEREKLAAGNLPSRLKDWE